MKALMFGWEFPPHILGGLGTASYGLTKGMSQQEDLETIFVIPKPWGDVKYLCIKDFHLPLNSNEKEIADFHAKLASKGIKGYAVGPIYMKSLLGM
jgi:hypothetical protein